MATPVLMPQQGNTVEECLLVAWKKKKGEAIEKGAILAEIETDKATFELEAPASGTLLATFVNEGELAPVLTNIAVIGNPGEAVDAFKPDKAKAKPAASAKAAPTPAKASAAAGAPILAVDAPQETGAVHLSPRARAFIAKHPVDLSLVRGSGPGGRITESDLRRAWNTKARTSPLAGQLLAEGANAPSTGSGPNALIRQGDLSEPGKPLTGIRAIIAERMMDSLLSTAQYTVSAQAPAERLLALRKKIKANTGKPGVSDITIGDMVMFACVKTLQDFPALNAELINNTLYQHKDISLGFACDTPKGLLVPVIKKCRDMKLSDLARRSKDLAQKAIDGKIPAEDLSGGTFTVSNLGSFGITSFNPVLNAPQVAILGVCAITLQPVRKEGKIEYADMIGFSLTADHQAVDGAQAARFLAALSKNIENIETIAGLKF